MKQERNQVGASLNRRTQWAALACYLALSAAGHLVWEVFQLPLYTIWQTESSEDLIVAIVHCTIGDVMIALSAMLVSVFLWRSQIWPTDLYWQVALTAVFIGVVYTGFSEWFNVYIRQSWQYANSMPVFNILGYDLGLSPLAQWIVVPGLVFLVLHRLNQVNAIGKVNRDDGD
ncbi:MAG: hypothetical protein KJ622_11140 [Alphaproteobacteria bacterium]|nr:hypothetical protein [Alphaproteobacteria bacterium]